MNTIVEIEPGAIAAVSKVPPEEARTKKRADMLVAMARSMEVTNPQENEFAADELRTIIKFHTELEAERVSFTGPINKVLDMLNARFQPYLKALRGPGSAEAIIKGKMATFAEKERLRVEAERREAERLAAAERRRLEDEADALRRKAEKEAQEAREAEARRVAAAQAEQARLDAAAAAARGKKAKEEALARAAELARQNAETAQKAQQEAAEKLQRAAAEAQALEQTAAVVTAGPVVEAARVSGISTPKSVDYEVTDKAEFIRFALEKRPDLLDLWEPDAAKMRALVKLQGLATTMPGLRVFPKTGITVR